MRYLLTYKDNPKEIITCHYVGDIYIEMEDRYNDEDYALDLQVWCENASAGDCYEDENVRILCELD